MIQTMNKYVNRDDVVVAFGQSLNNMFSRDDGEQIAMSLIKGIPTIEAPSWIPCSERLPKEDGWYLIALLTEHGTLYLPAHWYRGRWLNVNEHEDAVWMPIPSYTGAKETDYA